VVDEEGVTAMRVALMIEGQEGVGWHEWSQLARACERGGFDALFRSDHYNGLFGDESRQATDAWSVLAALAAVTERIRLGTLVSPVTFRHPSQIAKVVATVDHVSSGRVELGLGAGWNEREHTAYGFGFPPVDVRFSMLEEQVEIVRRSWAEGSFSFDGEHYRLDAVRAEPKPVQSPPTLVIGGRANRRSAALAARFADEYNTLGAVEAELIARRDRLAAACEAVGRCPDSLAVSVMTGCVVGRDRGEVLRRAEAVMARMGQDGDPAAFLADHAERWITGSVDEVRERLASLASVGVSRVMLQHLAHHDLDMVDLIGEELVGAV